jgi:hypothetical protein
MKNFMSFEYINIFYVKPRAFKFGIAEKEEISCKKIGL